MRYDHFLKYIQYSPLPHLFFKKIKLHLFAETAAESPEDPSLMNPGCCPGNIPKVMIQTSLVGILFFIIRIIIITIFLPHCGSDLTGSPGCRVIRYVNQQGDGVFL